MQNTISQNELVIIVPILRGKTEDVKLLAQELSDQRKVEYEISQKSLGITKESWFLQTSPQGDFVVVYAEGPDVANSLRKLIISRESFDLWLKEEVKKMTGFDFNKPPASELPAEILRYGY